MGAPLKLSGLHVFFFCTFSKSSSGFSAFRSWKSPIASGSTEHRVIAFLVCSLFMSGDLDLALCRLFCGVVLWERGLAGGRFLNNSDEKSEGLSEGRD